MLGRSQSGHAMPQHPAVLAQSDRRVDRTPPAACTMQPLPHYGLGLDEATTQGRLRNTAGVAVKIHAVFSAGLLAHMRLYTILRRPKPVVTDQNATFANLDRAA